MTKIFDESALSILPLPSGFIIAFRKADDESDKKMIVAYSLVSFEKETVSSVTRSVYSLAKFGQCYKLIESQLVNPFYWKTLSLPNDRVFAYYPDGKAKIFDAEARICWEGNILYSGKGASDVLLQGNSMWATFPDGNCIARFNLNTMREELRIGGENSAFSKPESIYLEGDNLLVCNAGNGKIWEVNTKNYAVYEHIEFDEPVHQFLKIDGVSLVHLDSGIYKL